VHLCECCFYSHRNIATNLTFIRRAFFPGFPIYTSLIRQQHMMAVAFLCDVSHNGAQTVCNLIFSELAAVFVVIRENDKIG
jgi:hypothetical protein